MRYIVSYSNPHNHYVDIEFVAANIKADVTEIQLPAWRPGRYELGNFAKNVQKWAAFDEKGNALKFEKKTKDLWLVQTKGVSQLHIRYNYYAAELNAGSTYLNTSQLYMNPVNCCVYIPSRIGEECHLELRLPQDYRVATGMTKIAAHSFIAKDFHELADSPFIASNSLQHQMFVLDGVEFNIWFQGECRPDWPRIITDFFIFINEQFVMMKECPTDVYHFLFQILPTRFYHGVEHLNSTVIALGPSYNLMKGDLYDNLLGVSSHELFHAWNIKSIRPIEMMPYDYTKENYSRLGYVCEGVTTYYGDFLLYRSGVFSDDDYFKTFNERVQKHFDNAGRHNLSVAASSVDTWLDGYVTGVPNRKTSIYDEGCLLAFITDIQIRKSSENRNSLDDVMRYLYFEFGKHNKGYSERDYKGIVEEMAGVNMDDLFNNYIWKAASYDEPLMAALDYIGCGMEKAHAKKANEQYYGFKVSEVGGVAKVTAVYPGSPADLAGIAVGDEIRSVNGFQVVPDASGTNLAEWSRYFGSQSVELGFVSNNIFKQTAITPSKQEYYTIYQVKKLEKPSEAQKKAFETWSKRKF